MKRTGNIGFCGVAIIFSLLMPVLHGQTDTVCFNDTILYHMPAAINADYTWNIPDGSVIYASGNRDSVIVIWNKETGLHRVEVTKQTEFCTGEPEILDVFVYKPVISLGPDRTICEGSSEEIAVDPGYTEYLWNNKPGTNTFTVSTEGLVTLEVKDIYGCWSKNELTVTVQKNPIPYFTVYTDSLSRNVSVVNLSDSVWPYHWDFGDGTSSEEYNPGQHLYPGSGIYVISLTASANGCSGSLSKEVYITASLTADFEAVYKGCAPAEVMFINRSTGADRYIWDFGNGDSSSDENPVTVYALPGTYKVLLYAKKDTTEDVSKRILHINPSPVADFEVSPDETVEFETISFINKSSNAVSYLWDFGDNSFSEVYEPSHSYKNTGVYDISLSVQSENGCSDSLRVPGAITVSNDCQLIFPNGFIPNKDGPSGGYYNPTQKEVNNEVFHPLYKNIEAYELKIYNRWGELVFLSKDITIGWDGYYKGKPAPQDTYLYVVTSRCLSGKEITKMGSISLIY